MRWTLHIGRTSRSLFVADSVSAVAAALAPEFAEFIAFSSLFLVLRLSSSDALDRAKGLQLGDCRPARRLEDELIITALSDSSCLDSSGFNRLSQGSTTRSLGRESEHIRSPCSRAPSYGWDTGTWPPAFPKDGGLLATHVTPSSSSSLLLSLSLLSPPTPIALQLLLLLLCHLHCLRCLVSTLARRSDCR